ncbi:unnamed protein product [Durusdinium trenchii]|uniref:Uncharacterized protein n=2 Tax=Durusdinium trenchii TaxID=1381693 RepID=A0ABP0PA93_9DINO
MAARTLAPLALALLALALHGCGKDEVRGDAEGQCGAESCSAPGAGQKVNYGWLTRSSCPSIKGKFSSVPLDACHCIPKCQIISKTDNILTIKTYGSSDSSSSSKASGCTGSYTQETVDITATCPFNISEPIGKGPVRYVYNQTDDGPGVVFELFSSPACEDWTSLNMVAVTPLDVCTNGLQKWVCIDGKVTAYRFAATEAPCSGNTTIFAGPGRVGDCIAAGAQGALLKSGC